MSLSLDAYDLNIVAGAVRALLWSVEHLWYQCKSEDNFLDLVYDYVREHCERGDEDCRRRVVGNLLLKRWWSDGADCLFKLRTELGTTLKHLSDGRLTANFAANTSLLQVDATSLAVMFPAHITVRRGDVTIAELSLTAKFKYSIMSGEWRIGFDINDVHIHETVRRALCLENPSNRVCRGYTPLVRTLSEFMP